MEEAHNNDEVLRSRIQDAAVELRRALQLARESNHPAFEESLRRAMNHLTQDSGRLHVKGPQQNVALTRMNARGSLARWQTTRIESFVSENLDRSISVAQLAQISNLSHSHFSRTFTRTFGQPPHLYISSRRIEHATKLMLTTTSSLGQIAADCGMSDQSHFNRMFKRFLGETPSAWRKARIRCPTKPLDVQATDPSTSMFGTPSSAGRALTAGR